MPTEHRICTLCVDEESPGFYTGCMVKDGHVTDWQCDGRGNLTRLVERPACEYCGPGKSTGLPGNACENCMNTGLKNPTPSDVIEETADGARRVVDFDAWSKLP